jgi:uncharacterized protein Usg
MRYFGEYDQGFRLSSVKVTYHMPDYSKILNEFWWQTMDVPPNYHRIKSFVNYWIDNLEATIHSLEVGHIDQFGEAKFKFVDKEFFV